MNKGSIEKLKQDNPSVDNIIIRKDGVSLRDQFAMAALNGVIAADPLWVRMQRGSKGLANQTLAGWAYALADAMLEARKKKA